MAESLHAKLAFLHRVFRQRQGWYWGAWGLLAVTWGAGIALLALSGWFITATALAGAGVLTTLELYVPSGGIRTAAIGRTLARYFERLTSHEAVLRSLADLRGRTFRLLAALPMGRIRAYRSGDLQTRLTGDIDTLDAAPLRVIGPMVAALLSLSATLALALWLAPWLAAALLVVAGATTLVVSVLLALAGHRRSQDLIHRRADERIALFDYVGGLAELLAYGRAHETASTLYRRRHDQARRQQAQETFGVLSEQIVQGVVGASALLMLVLALDWYREATISGPVAALLPLMTLGLGEVLGSLPGAWWRSGESLEAAGRIRHIEREGDTSPAPGLSLPDRPRLATRALEIGYRRERPLTAPLDLQLEMGKPLVVSGTSGSGKSTLLDTLVGELPPLAGTVTLGTMPLETIEADLRYLYISYLPQGVHLPDTTIGQLLAAGHPSLEDAHLWQALERVDLAASIKGTDEGLDYRIGEGGRQLSGGQRRRLALAALLLQDRDVVLLDEPFAGVDAATQDRLLQRLEPWLAQRQCAIVTHAPEDLPASWRRLELD